MSTMRERFTDWVDEHGRDDAWILAFVESEGHRGSSTLPEGHRGSSTRPEGHRGSSTRPEGHRPEGHRPEVSRAREESATQESRGRPPGQPTEARSGGGSTSAPENNERSTPMNDVRIPIGEVAVAGDSPASITIICEQGPFRMRGISLTDEEVTRHFMIDDIRIGRNSQLVACSAIPASFFGVGMTDRQRNLYFDTLPRGQHITVSVTNTSREPRIFRGLVTGDLADDYQSPRPHHLPLRRPGTDRFCVGLGLSLVPPKSRLTVRSQPTIVFRPDCLVVPEHVLELVSVTMVRAVGEILWLKSENIASGQAKFRFPPTMQVSDWLCVDVENHVDNQQFFSATVVGTSPRDSSITAGNDSCL